jgi:outer membrane protein W
MFIRKPLLLLFIIFGLNSLSIAQNCSEKIIEAQSFYDQGSFADCLSNLTECLNSEQEAERWKAYRLSAMAYLALNDAKKAKNAAYEMMTINPRYHANLVTDPRELVELIKEITIIPKFSFGLAASIGTNSTFPQIDDVYMVSDQRKTYKGRNSFQFGISSTYQINNSLGIRVAVNATTKSYKIDYGFANWESTAEEKLNYLMVPVAMTYLVNTHSRVRPFVQAGLYGGYLLNTKNSFESTYLTDGQVYSLQNVSSIDRRNRVDVGWTIGSGFIYKIEDGHLSLQVNFLKSSRNVVNPDTRYDDNDLMFSYHYLDDDFKLNNLTISIGYSVYLNYKVLKD